MTKIEANFWNLTYPKIWILYITDTDKVSLITKRKDTALQNKQFSHPRSHIEMKYIIPATINISTQVKYMPNNIIHILLHFNSSSLAARDGAEMSYVLSILRR
jgi:hypothetical protein